LYLSKKKKLFCTFIDFKAAFDKVWRTGLWTKMIKNNVNGKCRLPLFLKMGLITPIDHDSGITPPSKTRLKIIVYMGSMI
jgi:hypothetical protein